MNIVGTVDRVQDSQGRDIYGVTFPDLPGVETTARSFSELAEKAPALLARRLLEIESRGEQMPTRFRTVQEIMRTMDTGAEDARASLIVCSIPEPAPAAPDFEE